MAGGPAEYWLSPGEDAAHPDGQPVRLLDGTYPRTVASIESEYGGRHPVELLGVGGPGGELIVTLMTPGFRPYVPPPEEVVSAAITGDTLIIHARINPCVPREKLLLRVGPIHHTYPRSTTVWIETPDPGTEVFTVDLAKELGHHPCSISVLNGRCQYHNLEWNVPGETLRAYSK